MKSLFDFLKKFIYARSSNESIGLKGNVLLEQYRNGKRILKRSIHNIVTSVGKAQDAGLFNGVVTVPFTYLAIGTGTATAATGDTALGAEVTGGGGARSTATASRVSGTVANDTAQLVRQWDFTATFAVTESGIFDASSAGNLACRQVFSAVNVVSGDSLNLLAHIKVILYEKLFEFGGSLRWLYRAKQEIVMFPGVCRDYVESIFFIKIEDNDIVRSAMNLGNCS